MDFSAFLLLVSRTPTHPQQRRGQFVMGELHKVRPDLYLKVTGTLFDPYHMDSALPHFWTWLQENWG